MLKVKYLSNHWLYLTPIVKWSLKLRRNQISISATSNWIVLKFKHKLLDIPESKNSYFIGEILEEISNVALLFVFVCYKIKVWFRLPGWNMKKTVGYQHSGEEAEFKKSDIMILWADNCAISSTLHTHSIHPLKTQQAKAFT